MNGDHGSPIDQAREELHRIRAQANRLLDDFEHGDKERLILALVYLIGVDAPSALEALEYAATRRPMPPKTGADASPGD